MSLVYSFDPNHRVINSLLVDGVTGADISKHPTNRNKKKLSMSKNHFLPSTNDLSIKCHDTPFLIKTNETEEQEGVSQIITIPTRHETTKKRGIEFHGNPSTQHGNG